MMRLVNALPLPLALPLFLLLFSFSGLILYYASWRLSKGCLTSNAKEAAGKVYRNTGLLLSLLLSLTFAHVQERQAKLRSSIDQEAALISDIFIDLGRFGTPSAPNIQDRVVEYTKTLVEYEWPNLANDKMSKRSQALFEKIQDDLLHLDTHNPAQERLKLQLLEDIDAISDHRHIRLLHAQAKLPAFVFICLIGYYITATLFSVHPPCKGTVLFLGIYSIFLGMVLFLILAMNDPFAGYARVDPIALETILQDFIAQKP